MNSTLRQVLVPAVVILAALLLLQKFRGGDGGGVAPIPEVFAQGWTLAQANERSASSGKPVLVYATADWCGPCQNFKRTTLVDPGVVAFIRNNTIPVYLDVDRDQADAGRFNITSIPTTVLVRDGAEIAKLGGATGADTYLAWLNSEVAPK